MNTTWLTNPQSHIRDLRRRPRTGSGIVEREFVINDQNSYGVSAGRAGSHLLCVLNLAHAFAAHRLVVPEERVMDDVLDAHVADS